MLRNPCLNKTCQGRIGVDVARGYGETGVGK